MKLRYSPTSPYVRKVMITAIETGLVERIERVSTNVWAPDTDIGQQNPLGKVPTLVTDGGEALFDSPVICEYLDSLHQGAKLFPVGGGARWAALRRQALADGILDAALQIRAETAMRPAKKRWEAWTARQNAAIVRSLDALEDEAAARVDFFTIGEIAVVCALGYLDFRQADLGWRSGRPTLSAWYGSIAERPSVKVTAPHD